LTKLSIDALSPSGNKAWRLSTQHQWRKAKFAEPLREEDFATADPEEARPWLAGRLHKDWRGNLAWQSTPGRAISAPGEITVHAIAHRSGSPPMPQREELERVVATADPGARRVIALDLQGRFRLQEPGERPVSGDPALAAHGDSLSGARFLGPEATEDEAYLSELYRNFLGAWYQHLRSGRVSVYAGEPPWDLSAAELRERIGAWTPG